MEEGALMATKKTRLFMMSGNSQAVRIPREFQLDGDEVEIQQRGDTLVIRLKKISWAPLMDSLKKFTADFMTQGRRQPAIPKR
jgi:antitoxin VapB